MCICLQIIPEQVSFDGEISECEDTSQHSNISNTMNEESFDRLIPFHTLLDVSPNRSKAELAHKGALSQRQRPSADALRTAILRRTVSATSNVSQKYILIHVPELLLNCLHVKLLRSGLCFSRLQEYIYLSWWLVEILYSYHQFEFSRYISSAISQKEVLPFVGTILLK